MNLVSGAATFSGDGGVGGENVVEEEEMGVNRYG